MERLLIVNADDFGMSRNVNLGVLKAYRHGILTSASLMVRWPAAQEVVQRAEDIDLGLHIDLAEWAFRNGAWVLLYNHVPLEDVEAVKAEIYSQLECFRSLTGADPTHIDSHQHVHLQEPVRSVAMRMAEELSAPLRKCTLRIRYCGSFYGQSGKGVPCPEAISLSAMIKLLRALPPGATELACHPGEGRELNSTYSRERALEVDVLCHPQVRETIREENIRLCTFSELMNDEPMQTIAESPATCSPADVP